MSALLGESATKLLLQPATPSIHWKHPKFENMSDTFITLALCLAYSTLNVLRMFRIKIQLCEATQDTSLTVKWSIEYRWKILNEVVGPVGHGTGSFLLGSPGWMPLLGISWDHRGTSFASLRKGENSRSIAKRGTRWGVVAGGCGLLKSSLFSCMGSFMWTKYFHF